MVKKVRYVPIGILMVLLLTLPSVNLSDYPQSTITSKFMVFAYGVLLLLLGFVVMFLCAKPKNIKVSRLDIVLALLFGYIAINRYAIQGHYGFSIRYLELLGLGIVYVLIRTLSIRTFIGFLWAIVVSGSVQAIYGNLQLFGYYPSNHSGFKLTGSFFNPGPYAGFMCVTFVLALGLYLFKDKLNYHSISKNYANLLKSVFDNMLLVVLVSIVLVIPATQSRGAWLGTLLGSFFVFELRYGYIKNGLRRITRTQKIITIILVFSVLFAGLFGIYHFKKGSADGRLFIWKISSEIIKDYPLAGVGFDRFKAHYMNYQAHYFEKHGETPEALVADNSYYAFNDWLQFFTEHGVIGIVLSLVVLLVIFKIKVADKNRWLLWVIKGAFLAISTFALVSYPVQILPIKLVVVILLAFLARMDVNAITFSNIKYIKSYALLGAKSIVLILCGIGVLKGVGYMRNIDSGFKTWKEALTIYRYGDYEGATETYEKAYPILKKDGDFLMNYGKALTMHKQYKKAAQILEETKAYLNTTIVETALGDAYKGDKNYEKAIVAYQHAQNMIPIRFYPLYLQAKLYEESGDKAQAVAVAKTILNKHVKVPSMAIKEMQAEMKTILRND